MPAEAERPIRLVAGLGNPGREYENTRHNAGFLVIDRLAARFGLTLSFSNAWQALYGRAADGCMYLKPMTFMNLSGRSVQGIAQYYKVSAAETLIVFDDLALPLGQLRLRREGSAGGQNGMQSVIEHLGTTAVPRLRVGIGAAGQSDMVDHVLGKFTPQEIGPLHAAIERAADAVTHARTHGMDSAMNVFNRAAIESATPHSTTRQST
jgi:PTH1 family peptidyl-tRNA hydrolase